MNDIIVDKEKFITVKEVAKLFGYSEAWIYWNIQTGIIPKAHKIDKKAYWLKEEIEKLAAEYKPSLSRKRIPIDNNTEIKQKVYPRHRNNIFTFTDKYCDSLVHKNGRNHTYYFDARGLYIVMYPGGARTWRIKYKFNKILYDKSIGNYPLITAKKAQERTMEIEECVIAGIDPESCIKQYHMEDNKAKLEKIIKENNKLDLEEPQLQSMTVGCDNITYIGVSKNEYVTKEDIEEIPLIEASEEVIISKKHKESIKLKFIFFYFLLSICAYFTPSTSSWCPLLYPVIFISTYIIMQIETLLELKIGILRNKKDHN